MSTANIINMVGNVVNPPTTNLPDGQTPPISSGRQAEVLTGSVHGRYYSANYRGKMFNANVTAYAPLVVIGTGVVSGFTLYNPAGSGVNAEITVTEISQCVAGTIVNTYGWYRPQPAAAAAGTFTTLGTARSCRVGDTAANGVLFYSAYTHPNDSVLPIRVAVIGGYGATSNATSSIIRKEHNGELMLPPGNLISLLASTADSTAVGNGVAATWIEWPV